MEINIREIAIAFMSLFAVIDIIGSIPLVINLRATAGKIESGKATVISLIVMILFLFIGEEILSVIGISVSAFAVAGSLVLFFIALEMILGITIYKYDSPKTVSVVPLAFPVIAGAGSLTTLLSLRSELHVENIIIATVANLIVVFLVLKFSEIIGHFLGEQGISIFRRVFGVVLLALSLKFFATNVKELF